MVTVALVIVLFDGGMQIGLDNFITEIGATLWLGVVGTVVTAGAMAVLAHEIAGFGWRLALLLGTAVAPTDPAVVFSVLGRREISGRAGVLLQGESGANDPVGIALMLALLGATGSAGSITLHVLTTFVLEMAVGGAVGVLRRPAAADRHAPVPAAERRTVPAAGARLGAGDLRRVRSPARVWVPAHVFVASTS